MLKQILDAQASSHINSTLEGLRTGGSLLLSCGGMIARQAYDTAQSRTLVSLCMCNYDVSLLLLGEEDSLVLDTLKSKAAAKWRELNHQDRLTRACNENMRNIF